MRIRKTIFGRQKIKPNTFIGGVGATINTPALLASKLGIAVTRIKVFSVVGLEVQCAITGSYTIPASAFSGHTALTHYKDKKGLVTSFNRGTFYNCTSATEYEFPELTSMISAAGNTSLYYPETNFGYNTSLVNFHAPKLATIVGNLTFLGCTALTTFDAPLLKSMGGLIFSGCGNLISFNSILTTCGQSAFSGCSNVNYIDCSELIVIPNGFAYGCSSLVSINSLAKATSIQPYAFAGCVLLQNFTTPLVLEIFSGAFNSCKSITLYEFPELATISSSLASTWPYYPEAPFRENTALVTFSAPKLKTINNYLAFSECISLTAFYAPLLNKLGVSVGNNLVFQGLKVGATITVASVLATNNSDAPDGDLEYAISSRGATVIYI